MSAGLGAALVLVLMALAWLAIPFGLPGLWVMALGVAVLSLLGFAGWTPPLVALALVGLSEVVELLVLRSFGSRYGGSRRAFWGAVAGGFLGVFVGVPVPLVGPVVTAFLGTFLGALAVTWFETRSLAGSARVGWGMVLARTVSVGLKMGTGIAFLVWAVILVVF